MDVIVSKFLLASNKFMSIKHKFKDLDNITPHLLFLEAYLDISRRMKLH